MSDAAAITGGPVRVLTFTSLYPNPEQPALGLFVERRLTRLIDTGQVEAVVVAPIPWFPLKNTRFAGYGKYARVPKTTVRGSVRVCHPRFVSVPGLNQYLAPIFMFLCALTTCMRLKRTFGVELMDAHYLYPDAAAAAAIARVLKVPLVATARGTDVNLLPDYRFCRSIILWVTRVAARLITVSDALRDRLVALGADPTRVVTLRNGVDLQEFAPRDQAAARRKLGLDERTIVLSVGNLVEEKGHDLAIQAVARLAGVELIIVGEGRLRKSLEDLATSSDAAGRVQFTGSLASEDLLNYYSAADALVLASSREGMPNVVLEALACGLPVVATNSGGVAEVLDPSVGVLLDERTPQALSAALRSILDRRSPREAVRSYAARLGWDATIERQTDLYRKVARSGCGVVDVIARR